MNEYSRLLSKAAADNRILSGEFTARHRQSSHVELDSNEPNEPP
ncbi:MAG: hypothetical protein WA146_03040 [Thiobacillus sp.]